MSPFLPFTGEHGEPLAIWVASAIDKIPPGSLIINPQTGKPYMNPDGSVYRWFPPTDKLATTSASHPSPVERSKVCHIASGYCLPSKYILLDSLNYYAVGHGCACQHHLFSLIFMHKILLSCFCFTFVIVVFCAGIFVE